MLEFFRPRSAALGALTSWWLRWTAALFARGAVEDYGYLRTSIARTCSAEEFVAEAEAEGFTAERVELFLPACACVILKNVVK